MSTVDNPTPGTPCWIDLMTTDASAARTFYGELLGWEFEIGGPEFGGYTIAKVAGHNAAGIGQKPASNPYPTAWSVYFASEDADATAAAISANGGQIMLAPIDIGEPGRMLIAADSGGAVFGVWQPKAHTGVQVVGEPGALAWCEVNSTDAGAAVAFYSGVFGLVGKPMPAALPTVYHTLHVSADAAAVCGVLQMNAHWAGVPPHWMAYFAVADIAASVARVGKLGGKVVVPPFDTPYGRIAVVNDPQGAAFTIIQLPTPAG